MACVSLSIRLHTADNISIGCHVSYTAPINGGTSTGRQFKNSTFSFFIRCGRLSAYICYSSWQLAECMWTSGDKMPCVPIHCVCVVFSFPSNTSATTRGTRNHQMPQTRAKSEHGASEPRGMGESADEKKTQNVYNEAINYCAKSFGCHAWMILRWLFSGRLLCFCIWNCLWHFVRLRFNTFGKSVWRIKWLYECKTEQTKKKQLCIIDDERSLYTY